MEKAVAIKVGPIKHVDERGATRTVMRFSTETDVLVFSRTRLSVVI